MEVGARSKLWRAEVEVGRRMDGGLPEGLKERCQCWCGTAANRRQGGDVHPSTLNTDRINQDHSMGGEKAKTNLFQSAQRHAVEQFIGCQDPPSQKKRLLTASLLAVTWYPRVKPDATSTASRGRGTGLFHSGQRWAWSSGRWRVEWGSTDGPPAGRTRRSRPPPIDTPNTHRFYETGPHTSVSTTEMAVRCCNEQ